MDSSSKLRYLRLSYRAALMFFLLGGIASLIGNFGLMAGCIDLINLKETPKHLTTLSITSLSFLIGAVLMAAIGFAYHVYLLRSGLVVKRRAFLTFVWTVASALSMVVCLFVTGAFGLMNKTIYEYEDQMVSVKTMANRRGPGVTYRFPGVIGVKLRKDGGILEIPTVVVVLLLTLSMMVLAALWRSKSIRHFEVSEVLFKWDRREKQSSSSGVDKSGRDSRDSRETRKVTITSKATSGRTAAKGTRTTTRSVPNRSEDLSIGTTIAGAQLPSSLDVERATISSGDEALTDADMRSMTSSESDRIGARGGKSNGDHRKGMSRHGYFLKQTRWMIVLNCSVCFIASLMFFGIGNQLTFSKRAGRAPLLNALFPPDEDLGLFDPEVEAGGVPYTITALVSMCIFGMFLYPITVVMAVFYERFLYLYGRYRRLRMDPSKGPASYESLKMRLLRLVPYAWSPWMVLVFSHAYFTLLAALLQLWLGGFSVAFNGSLMEEKTAGALAFQYAPLFARGALFICFAICVWELAQLRQLLAIMSPKRMAQSEAMQMNQLMGRSKMVGIKDIGGLGDNDSNDYDDEEQVQESLVGFSALRDTFNDTVLGLADAKLGIVSDEEDMMGPNVGLTPGNSQVSNSDPSPDESQSNPEHTVVPSVSAADPNAFHDGVPASSTVPASAYIAGEAYETQSTPAVARKGILRKTVGVVPASALLGAGASSGHSSDSSVVKRTTIA